MKKFITKNKGMLCFMVGFIMAYLYMSMFAGNILIYELRIGNPELKYELCKINITYNQLKDIETNLSKSKSINHLIDMPKNG